MTAPLDAILDDLSTLIACDTRNPPRDIAVDSPIIAALRARLDGLDMQIQDFGEGCLAILATRGAPRTLFNVHLDTVPVAEGWTQDPFVLTRGADRAGGLGACDIKGAAACLIAAATAGDEPVALLFTTDEEAGTSVAVRGFLEGNPRYDRVIVAEPTSAKALLSHRGVASLRARFTGASAHSSAGGASAVHAAAQWVVSALAEPWAAENRLNVGRIEGGVKPNMVAAACALRFGLRCRPGVDLVPHLEALRALGGEAMEEMTLAFEGPPLPIEGPEAARRQEAMASWLTGLGVEIGEPANFWTEASLFCAAGHPVAVLGPGDIAQAHAADEWVSFADLAAAFDAYRTILAAG